MTGRNTVLLTFLTAVALAACSAPAGGAPGSPSPDGSSPSAAATGTESPTASPPASPSELPSSVPSAESPSSQPSGSGPAGTMTVRNYYFLDDATGGDPGLVPVLRTVPKSSAVARAAITALLAGPTTSEAGAKPPIVSWIPDGTRLLGIGVSGGTATVDLSSTFTAHNATFSVGGRIAQVVYTLTQFPTVDRVVVKVGGTEIAALSPATRATFRDTYQPPMFVDLPAWGAALDDGGRVAGSANVFEAQFRIALLDAKGDTLFDRPVLATCGSGCWGTFSLTASYTVPSAQTGTLRVWDPSEIDGSPQNVREYPVRLTP